jgi:hypothetical protein
MNSSSIPPGRPGDAAPGQGISDEQVLFTRRKFTPSEDAKLRSLVPRHGEINWHTIATYFTSRTPRQLRERWKHYLAPTVNTGPWTFEEDWLLVQKTNELGPVWAYLTQFFDGRSDMALKNRFLGLQRRMAAVRPPPSLILPSFAATVGPWMNPREQIVFPLPEPMRFTGFGTAPWPARPQLMGTI